MNRSDVINRIQEMGEDNVSGIKTNKFRMYRTKFVFYNRVIVEKEIET